MKKTYFLLSIALSFVLIAASDGVGEDQNKDRSGSPDGDNVCSQCHSSGAFSPEIDFSIMDNVGNEITEYIPGETYMLTYTVSGSGSTIYGFQSTALTSQNENAGEFINPGSQVQLETVDNANVSNRSVVEHSSPSATGEFLTEWTAPSQGSGDVTFYFSGVAANANGMSSGDGFNGSNVSITEDTDISVEENLNREIKLSFTDGNLNLFSSANSTTYSLSIYSISGAKVLEVENVSLPLSIPSSELSKGVNILNLVSQNESIQFKVLH